MGDSVSDLYKPGLFRPELFHEEDEWGLRPGPVSGQTSAYIALMRESYRTAIPAMFEQEGPILRKTLPRGGKGAR